MSRRRAGAAPGAGRSAARKLLRTVARAGAPLALLLAAAAAARAASPDAPPLRYLVVGASDASPGALARRARPLAEAGQAAGDGPGLLLSSADCLAPRGRAAPVYAWAAAVADSAAQAEAVLARLRPRVPDAYVRRCQPRPGSLLALGLPAVHPSIAGVPEDAVNWTDADRLSRVLPPPAAGGPALLLQGWYDPQPEDPLEGRRRRVLLLPAGGAPQTLRDDCGGVGAPGSVAVAAGWLALACDSGQAAEWTLHTVHVFSADGRPVAEVAQCRRPRLVAPATLRCQAETVDADGRLRLAPRTLTLARP